MAERPQDHRLATYVPRSATCCTIVQPYRCRRPWFITAVLLIIILISVLQRWRRHHIVPKDFLNLATMHIYNS